MFSTLVTFPSTVHPEVYTYVNGVAHYTAIDYIGRYAYDHGISFDQALYLDSITDLREHELSNRKAL